MEPAEQDLLHVLVLDDDADMRELFTRILLPRGHQVFSVGSAEEALQLLPYTTFQVAFLDHHLPGMEGAVLADYLRKNNPHLEIALVTGADDEELARFGVPEGVSVIKKPFQVGAVLDRISAYRAQADARQQARLERADPEYQVPLASHLAALPAAFGVARVAQRLEERLIQTVRDALNELRSVSRYNERDRVVAYAGLITIKVLGVRAPRTSAGLTLFQEYDELMRAHGRSPDFGDTPDDSA